MMAHLTTEKYLNKENMLFYLDKFALCMKNKYGSDLNFNVLIVGGSALALKDAYRNSTVDIDSSIKFSSDVTSAIRTVARTYNIYNDWLNQDFMYSESYSRRLEDGALYYCTLQNCLNIYVVNDLDQLCMKATAYRRKDIPDIKFLVKTLRLKGCTFEVFLNQFYYLYGDSVSLKRDARLGIEKLFKVKLDKIKF